MTEAQAFPPTPFHPSTFIQDELDARGWTRADLANRMGAESCVRNLLVLDMYFEVGPTRTNCRLGEKTDAQIAQAFGISPGFFLRLEAAWLRDMASLAVHETSGKEGA